MFVEIDAAAEEFDDDTEDKADTSTAATNSEEE